MLQATTSSAPDTTGGDSTSLRVREFRQILLWPLRLLNASHSRHPWTGLCGPGIESPWREQVDEYTGEADGFHERHYNEFVAFLPYVQRFLYGEGRSGRTGSSEDIGSPMRVFRRDDVAQVRMVPHRGQAPVTLEVIHVDLYFFYDLDLVLLNVEVAARDLPLPLTQEILYRFGRAYPAGWDASGDALHSLAEMQWLAADGSVLASSDSSQRETFLSYVAEHRAPRIASHWAWLLKPLVSDHSSESGHLRYRQIEYYRMPLMAYLALDEPRRLGRTEFMQLALVTGGGGVESAHAAGDSTHHADFESRYCYDRFWVNSGAAPNTRYLCCGHALVVVGQFDSNFFVCRDRGVLAQFRHQHFLLFLIAHLQKAALLMFSDRLVEALRRLNVTHPESVKQFKREIRHGFEGFLRFTHRYWFHEISEQVQVRALSHLCNRHLGLDPLYVEVKERIADMNTYLDADSLRRQANTVVRLTVVTIFGLIGTVTTGFLGMNLLAEADSPMSQRILLFAIVFILTTVLTVYTMVKSKRLSDFLDALSDERMSAMGKIKSLLAVWKAPSE